ncbi:MAG: hypothetical protein DDT32_01219 [Syntrophomonadaceae bacterium]|nr:hypothetical protein [Bacillota bacterium]MBT9147462.1 hypothetical protein [Bacillota bacterium]
MIINYRGIIKCQENTNTEKLLRVWTTSWHSTYEDAFEVAKLLKKYEYKNKATITIETQNILDYVI